MDCQLFSLPRGPRPRKLGSPSATARFAKRYIRRYRYKSLVIKAGAPKSTNPILEGSGVWVKVALVTTSKPNPLPSSMNDIVRTPDPSGKFRLKTFVPLMREHCSDGVQATSDPLQVAGTLNVAVPVGTITLALTAAKPSKNKSSYEVPPATALPKAPVTSVRARITARSEPEGASCGPKAGSPPPPVAT